MIEIILFAIVAFFIYKKLFSVLGDNNFDRRDELEARNRMRMEEFKKSVIEIFEEKQAAAKQIDIVSGMEAALNPEDRVVFDKIRDFEPSFSADSFVKGAKVAHELIIKAFSEDDREALKAYMEQSFFESYQKQMDQLGGQGRVTSITIIRVQALKVFSSSISIEKRSAVINTRIVSEQTKVTKDKETGEIIAGDPSKVMLSDEIWTFQKSLGKSTIWKLAGIHLTGTAGYELRESDEI